MAVLRPHLLDSAAQEASGSPRAARPGLITLSRRLPPPQAALCTNAPITPGPLAANVSAIPNPMPRPALISAPGLELMVSALPG